MRSKPPRKAAVIGANGQDGRLICRRLMSRGYDVLAIGRQHNTADADPTSGSLAYCRVDLAERGKLGEVLAGFKPEAVFHLAAAHASSGNALYERRFAELIDVNLISLHETLETLRALSNGARLVYASSAKVFGAKLKGRITEETPFHSDCLYALSKNAARDLIDYYRRSHGLNGTVLFFFNHESEFRPADFFIPRLVAGVARAVGDKTARTELATLDFHADWGSAEEYMDITIDVAERAPATDFIVATGRTTYARDLADSLFTSAGLDYRNHIVETSGLPGQGPFTADIARLRDRIGRTPAKGALDVCKHILSLNYGAP